jgi:hypothetical protein
MLFLALALPAIYAYAPPDLEDMAKPRWLDHIGGFIARSLTSAKPRVELSPVDPIAAANVDEDLDYRIAQRTRSTEGWRTFLTAHPDGPHAQLARAELDKVVPSETPAAPVALQASSGGAQTPQTPREVASPDSSSARSEVATPASDEICRRDEDRLEQLSNSLTGDGVVRFLIELRCEKLRPQILRLAERLDDKAPAAASVAVQGPAVNALPESVDSAPPLPPPRMRENELQKKPRSNLASRGLQSRRHAGPSTAPSLPPFLLALFGEGPRSSTGVRRTRAGGGPGSGAGGH